ncbi:MAG: hypothetical protein LBR83_07610, partial [Clostridiales bacterium]|nr:hypothetical protein [Clostridiales bacterium]
MLTKKCFTIARLKSHVRFLLHPFYGKHIIVFMFKYVPEQLGLSDDIEEDDNTGNRVIIDSFDKLKQKYKS